MALANFPPSIVPARRVFNLPEYFSPSSKSLIADINLNSFAWTSVNSHTIII